MTLIAKLRRSLQPATAIVFLFFMFCECGPTRAVGSPAVGSDSAAQVHASVKQIKAHKRHKSRFHPAKSHKHYRTHKRAARTRAPHPQARIERVHVVRHRRHHVVTHPVEELQAIALPEVPQAPPVPDWPANDKPTTASVNWDGRALSISAKNSSLTQILADVATATGVKVEGQSGDQRVYGSYGPASAREVLNDLLDGSDYNIVMMGDSGDGTPRELVLSKKVKISLGNPGAGFAKAAPDDDADDEAEPPEPAEPIRRRPFGQDPARQLNPQTPEEQQMRLQQMQRQLQQQAMPADSPAPAPAPAPAQQQRPNE